MKTTKMLEIAKKVNEPIQAFLKRKYYDEKASISEIAKSIGVSRSCVCSWFKNLKIPTRNATQAQAIVQNKKLRKYSSSKIKNMYLKKGLSQQKIASVLGLNQATVSKILIKEGVRSRMTTRKNYTPYNKKDIGREKLKELYLKNNFSTHKIAKLVGVKQITVFRWLKKYGIERRNLSQAQFRFRGKIVKKPTKQELYKLYILEKKGEPHIAKMLKTDTTTISNWLKEYGIKRRSAMEAKFVSLGKDIRKPSREELYKWYVKDKMSMPQIAKKLGISVTPLTNWLKEYNIKIRSGSEALFNVYGKEIKKPTRSQLKRWYLIEKMSCTEIGKITGASKTTVLSWLQEEEIIRRGLREATLSTYKRRPDLIKLIRSNRLKQIFPKKDTQIEKKMQKELKRRGIKFRVHLPVENICQPDIIIPEQKIIIQCDGDYWHANPKIYKNKKLTEQQKKIVAKDKNQDKLLKSRGWVVLRFWESDINSDASKCVDKIVQVINNARRNN